MIIRRVIYTQDMVSLVNETDALDMTYAAWHKFVSERGSLSIPFELVVETTNVRDIHGAGDRVIITEAKEIAQ